jgi:hypothetical protein
VLKVVQEQQQVLLLQGGDQRLRPGLPRRFPDVQRLRDGGQHQARVAQRRERDERDSIREVTGHGSRHRQRHPRLADAACTGQGKEAHVDATQQLHRRGNFLLSSD